MSVYICSVCGYHRDPNYHTPMSVAGQVNNIDLEFVCPVCRRQRLTQCAYCQEWVTLNNTGKVSETQGTLPTGHACGHCIQSNNLQHCYECSLYKPVSDMTNETSNLCNKCYSDNYTHCRDCGHLMRRERVTIAGHVTYRLCRNCRQYNYPECYMCGHVYKVSDLEIIDHHCVCHECVTNHCHVCEDCRVMAINTHPCSDGLSRCERCLQSQSWQYCNECHMFCELGHHHMGIRSYSYKPSPIFIGKNDDNLFYGIELECESSGQMSVDTMSRELVTNYSDNESLFYIKGDGSLRDGLEVVSHPHTLTKMVNAQWLETVTNELTSKGYKSHDTVTCGLHVHMSRCAFIDGIHETKFSYFIYESDFTQKVARRDFNHYCEKIDKHLSASRPDNVGHSRYEGVNFTNSETIEVRVFKGTLKLNTIIVCLLYCDAVYQFTKISRLTTLTSSDRDTEFIKFIQYKPKYAKLLYYLTQSQSSQRGGDR